MTGLVTMTASRLFTRSLRTGVRRFLLRAFNIVPIMNIVRRIIVSIREAIRIDTAEASITIMRISFFAVSFAEARVTDANLITLSAEALVPDTSRALMGIVGFSLTIFRRLGGPLFAGRLEILRLVLRDKIDEDFFVIMISTDSSKAVADPLLGFVASDLKVEIDSRHTWKKEEAVKQTLRVGQ